MKRRPRRQRKIFGKEWKISRQRENFSSTLLHFKYFRFLSNNESVPINNYSKNGDIFEMLMKREGGGRRRRNKHSSAK